MLKQFSRSSEFIIDLDFLLENKDFFNTLFSIHYPFSFSELNEFEDEIKTGIPVYSFYDIEYLFISRLGISYNAGIKWTNSLIKQIKFEQHSLAYVYFDENDLPLDKFKEVDKFDEACSDENSNNKRLIENFPYLYKGLLTEDCSRLSHFEFITIIDDYSNGEYYTRGIMLNSTFYKYIVNRLKNKIDDINGFYTYLKYIEPQSKKEKTD